MPMYVRSSCVLTPRRVRASIVMPVIIFPSQRLITSDKNGSR